MRRRPPFLAREDGGRLAARVRAGVLACGGEVSAAWRTGAGTVVVGRRRRLLPRGEVEQGQMRPRGEVKQGQRRGGAGARRARAAPSALSWTGMRAAWRAHPRALEAPQAGPARTVRVCRNQPSAAFVDREHELPPPVRRRPRSPAVGTRHRHLSASTNPLRRPPPECPTRIGLCSYKKEGSSSVTSIRFCAWTTAMPSSPTGCERVGLGTANPLIVQRTPSGRHRCPNSSMPHKIQLIIHQGASHQALPVQGEPGPSDHHPDVPAMGGGSGQTNAPCGDIYVREGVVAVHHTTTTCAVLISDSLVANWTRSH